MVVMMMMVVVVVSVVPVTSSNPDDSFFKHMTLLPLNLPAMRISTVPSVMLDLTLGAFLTGVGPLGLTSSSAG